MSLILYTLSTFLLLAFAQAASSSTLVLLSNQCWHEYPLTTVNLLNSRNGLGELVEPLQSHIFHMPSTLRKDEQPIANDPHPHHPWTYAPVCTEVLQSIGDKLCVYTNATFANGRGISIFTTPRIAQIFSTLPPFQDPSILASNEINTPSNVWTATSLPGKGIGLIAARPLVFKDRVTAYTPAFLAYLEEELSTAVREHYWRIAVNQLPERTRELYLDLAKVYGDPRVVCQDVVKANAFQMEVGGIGEGSGEGKNHLAIFPETARINHACAPNAQYYLDPKLLTHFVHVTRPITKGEEITISYTSPLASTSERQSHLTAGFHFTCTCSRCTHPSSDTKLSLMSQLQASLNDWSPSSPATPAMAEQVLDLYRQEGLEGFMDIPYGFAALAYNAVGDKVKATMFAKKAEEAVLMKDGEWSQNLGMWREMLSGMEEHWSWKRRV